MRALLVDPFKREVREVAFEGDFRMIRQFVAQGEPGPKQVPFSSGVPLHEKIITWVDDEGIFRPDQAWFAVRGYVHPLAGYMLVQGRNGPNETDVPIWLTIDRLLSVIDWLEPDDAEQRIQPTTISSLDIATGAERVVDVIHHDISQKRPI